jgi:hypothetical protein
MKRNTTRRAALCLGIAVWAAGCLAQADSAGEVAASSGDFSGGLRTNDFFSGGWRVKDRPEALSLASDLGHAAPPCGKVTFDPYVQVQHCVPVKPNCKFRISAWVNIDSMTGSRRLEFHTEPNTLVQANPKLSGWQRLETRCASGSAKALVLTFTSSSSGGSFLIDDVKAEELGSTLRDAGAVCYTGNAPGEQARHNRRVEGRYTYCELGTDAPFFPQTEQKGLGDVAEFYGWIPFATGRLTDGQPTSVRYHEWTLTPGKTILVDLGADRFVTDVELDPEKSGLRQVRLYAKPALASHYTLVAMPEVLGGTIDITPIDAHARFLRIDSDGSAGLSEIRVWGQDKPGAVAPRPFARPVIPAAPPGAGGAALADTRFAIFPTPKEAKPETGRLYLPPDARIGVAAAAPAEIGDIAADLAERLQRATGLPAGVATGAPAPIILRVASPRGGREDQGPEGYGLTITPAGAVVTGGDADGLFYGCQTLLQCLTPETKGFALRAIRVRDWPSYPLRMLEAWPKQFARDAGVERIVRTFARMKMNHVLMMGMDDPALPVSRRLAKLRMQTVVRCLSMPGNAAWPRLELNPGETRQSLPSLERVNPCPSDPANLAFIAQEAAKAAPFPGTYANLICDEMYQEQKGARWNVCPLCAARKLPGGELYREFIQTIYDSLAKVGKKPMMLDTMYCVPYKGMNDAFASLPKDIPVIVWHPPVQKGLAELGYPVGQFFNKDKWSIDPHGRNVIGGLVPADGGFKIERMAVVAEALWSGTYPDLSDPAALARISEVMVQVHEAVIDAALPSRTARPETFLPLDLSAIANASLADGAAGDGEGFLDLGPGTDLSFMRGEHILHGVPFRIGGKNGRDFVAMDNRGSLDPVFPSEVRIPIGCKAASLVFLHTLSQPLAWSYSAQLTYASAYVVDYADGTRADFPIEYKQNILEYNALDAAGGDYKSSVVTLPRAVPAYKGTLSGGETILLLAAEWVNPCPRKEIAAIRMRSTSRRFGTRVALFALTAVQPTARDETFWAARPGNAYAAQSPVAIPAGLTEIDLSGGEIKPGADYVAPDGTRISATRCYTLMGATFITHMHPGLVTVNGNAGWQIQGAPPGTLTVMFPAARHVAAVSLLGLPQSPEYLFGGPSPMDYTLEGSADGVAWTPLGARAGYLPDRDWESNHVFAPRPLKAVRVTLAPADSRGSQVRGLARVRIFTPEET